jgi:RecA/RadA recombinase
MRKYNGEKMESQHMKETDILTILFCKSKEVHPYIIKILPEFFSEKLRVFYSIFQEYYQKYMKAPSKTVFNVEFEGDDRVKVIHIFDAIQNNFEKIKDLEQDYILEKLDLFVKKSFIKKTLIQSYDEFELGEYDKIIRSFGKLNEAIVDSNMGSNYFDPEFFMGKYIREKSGLSIFTGSNQFDSNFGGLHRKSLSIVAGPSNSGKTMFLTNMAASMLEMRDQNKNILYVTLEIDEEAIGKRVDANLLCTPVKDLGKKLRDNHEGDILAQKFIKIKENQNRLVIKSMRGGSTPSDIAALIRNLWIIPMSGEDKPFKPDVVMVDYLGLLQPTITSKNMNSYDKGRNISEELRQIAQDFNLAMVAAAQTNRGSFGNEVTQDSISDSIAIAQTADLMLTINRNEELDRNGQVVIYLAKSRFSRTGVKFIFNADYDCMRFEDVDVGHISDETIEEVA